MKKLISMSLAAMLSASAFTTALSFDANAQTSDEYVEYGLHYKLCDGNKAVLTGCDDDIDSIYLYSMLENGYFVTSVADGAFKGNMKLTSFSCNSELESVGEYAFESCSKLKTLYFGGVEKIGKGAFSMCSALEYTVLGKKLKSIDKGAFFYDTNLRAFTFPKNFETVGEYAFAFSGLTSVIMNNKLKQIPDRTFYGCSMLQSVRLPNKLESIGDYAFTSCENLDIEEIPETLDSIGDYAFKGCAVSDLDFKGSQIGEGAFERCKSMDTVVFSDNLKEVGKTAFADTSVKKIVLPDNADYQNGAFAGMNTDAYTLSENNDKYTVKDGVVFSKDMKTLVCYPAGDSGDETYDYDAEVKREAYTVPDGVEEIAPYAFYHAGLLSEAIMPDSVERIGAHAFEACAIDKLTIPSKVKTIEAFTFNACSGLTEVDLSSVETIEDMAFCECSYQGLDIKLPDTLKEFSPMAFLNANVNIKASGNYKDINGTVCTADGKKLVYCPMREDEAYTIPDGIEEIGYRAFSSNMFTTEIYIPDSLKKIDMDGLEYRIHYSNGYETKYFSDGIHLIGKASKEVKAYADAHNIGVFTERPSQNIESVTLKGKETAEFSIFGANTADIVYTSSDDRICSVSEDGTITGLGKGTTYVTAAVGTSYFKCKVKVTSNSGIKYTGFDDSKYYKVTGKTYQAWRQHYLDENSQLTADYREGIDETAMSAYQGNTFYKAMNGAADSSGDNHAAGEERFGKGYEEMIAMINHACVTELDRYNNPDTIVLYSGAKPYASRLVAGEVNTLKNLKAAVGKKFTHKQFISTTLDPMVANNFYSHGEGVVLIIYAEKTALDNLPSALLAALHSQFNEYEQLFACGAEFEVIDAGVRWFDGKGIEDSYDGDYQRYVKLKLLGGTQDPQPLPTPVIKLEKTSAALYVQKKTTIKYSLDNCYDNEIKFKSSNEKVAKVNKNGKITAIKKGTAIITVYNSEVSTKFKITVKNPTLNKTKLMLKKGKSFTLKITGKAGTQTFKSANTKIAAVSKKGVIKAKSKGKTTITVTTNGMTLKCKIVVSG